MKRKGLIIFLVYFVLQVIRVLCSYKSFQLGILVAYIIGFFAPLLLIRYYESNYRKVFGLTVMWEVIFLLLAIIIDGDISFGTPITVGYFLAIFLAYIFYKFRPIIVNVIVFSLYTILATVYFKYGHERWLEFILNKEVVRSTDLGTINFVEPGKGKVNDKGISILYFWSEFCPPCIKHLPQYKQLAERNSRREGIHFYTVYLQTDTAIIKNLREPSPVLEELFITQKEAGRIGVVGIPKVLVFENGTLKEYFHGYDNFEEYFNNTIDKVN